eukprot:XP_001708698.1 Hypothetical protein GL50803_32328 [Giardia lamblia ATCC 50803]
MLRSIHKSRLTAGINRSEVIKMLPQHLKIAIYGCLHKRRYGVAWVDLHLTSFC